MSWHTSARMAVLVLASTWALGAHAVDVVFKPVTEGVYAYVGDIEGRTYDNEGLNANIGLVVTPAGAVLIDSGASFQGARQIADAVRKVTSQPIRWVVNTGGQDHRWLGNGYFKANGAEIIAHADAQADMKARAHEHMAALKPVLKEKFDGTEPSLPTRFLNGPGTQLEFGGVVLEIQHRHGGHTPGDSIVWLPQKNVVFSGDVVYVDRVLGLHPVSKTKAWLESFAMIEALNPAVIVPGHGRITTLALARAQTRDLLQSLRNHMSKAVEAGTDMSTAIKTFDGTPFMGLKHAAVWIPQLANFTYLEIEQE